MYSLLAKGLKFIPNPKHPTSNITEEFQENASLSSLATHQVLRKASLKGDSCVSIEPPVTHVFSHFSEKSGSNKNFLQYLSCQILYYFGTLISCIFMADL